MPWHDPIGVNRNRACLAGYVFDRRLKLAHSTVLKITSDAGLHRLPVSFDDALGLTEMARGCFTRG